MNISLVFASLTSTRTETVLSEASTAADKMRVSADAVVKHPLQNEWSFWMFTNREKDNWEANLVEMVSFDTVEDYWCLYHHMKTPSELDKGQDYLVFKKGIRPMWEDMGNKSGGRWLLMLDGVKPGYMDSIWSDVVLLLIGVNFEHSDEINGVVVNIRDKNKISIWMRSINRKAIVEVGRKLRVRFRLPCRIHFYKHNSSTALYSF
ncbi:hypothetical protein PYW07_015618 [Mythimna separata]|uniref:eIF-4F 25 kDa subunit n=1 Tax=Mythimna separata TaxID=271217 RepID=A0AAD7YYU6_MYTSE|nr:hypothetical protein PYW07_015618 [Mythimna separata]